MNGNKQGPLIQNLHALFWDYLLCSQCSLFPLFTREKYGDFSIFFSFASPTFSSSHEIMNRAFLAFSLLGFQPIIYAMINTHRGQQHE